MNSLDIEINRGEYREQTFTIYARDADGNPTGDPLDISEVEDIVWVVKKRAIDADADAKIAKKLSTDDVAFVTDGTDGKVRITCQHADTISLGAGVYVHQLWIVDSVLHRQPAFSEPARFKIVQPAWLGT